LFKSKICSNSQIVQVRICSNSIFIHISKFSNLKVVQIQKKKIYKIFRFETVRIFIIVHFRKIKNKIEKRKKKEKYLLLGRSQTAHEKTLCGRVLLSPARRRRLGAPELSGTDMCTKRAASVKAQWAMKCFLPSTAG
jgi:hypothetical protein